MNDLIFISDLHIHNFRIGSVDGGTDRLRDGLRVLRQSLELARTHNCLWVFGGDWKMPKRLWVQEALNGSLAVLQEFPDVEKLIIPGNHDGEGEWGTGLRSFAQIRNTTVMELWGIYQSTSAIRLAVWPYGAHQLNLFPDLVERAENAQTSILIGHAFFAGVLLGADELQLPNVGVSLDTFGLGTSFMLGLFGDVHKGQRLVRHKSKPPRWMVYEADAEHGQDPILVRPRGAWRGEIFYPGSPYPQSWGEASDWPKGALRVDLKTGEVWLCPLQSPRFRIVDWRAYELEALRSFALGDDMDGMQISQWEGDCVRLYLGEWAVESNAAYQVTQEIKTQSRARTFQVLLPPPTPKGTRIPIHAGLPLGEVLAQYVAARPLSGISNPHTLAAGKKLLEEPS